MALSPGRTLQVDMPLRLTDSNSPSPKRVASPHFDGGTPQKLIGSAALPASPSPRRRRSASVRHRPCVPAHAHLLSPDTDPACACAAVRQPEGHQATVAAGGTRAALRALQQPCR
jgi:hypothetical protein